MYTENPYVANLLYVSYLPTRNDMMPKELREKMGVDKSTC